MFGIGASQCGKKNAVRYVGEREHMASEAFLSLFAAEEVERGVGVGLGDLLCRCQRTVGKKKCLCARKMRMRRTRAGWRRGDGSVE